MIYFYLIMVAALYVVVAVVVGKICAINSRWEQSVDRLVPGRLPEAAHRKGASKTRPAGGIPLHAIGAGEREGRGTTF